VLAGAVIAVRFGLGRAGAGRLAVVVAGVAAGAAAFLAAAIALRCPELTELLRIRAKSPGDSGTME